MTMELCGGDNIIMTDLIESHILTQSQSLVIQFDLIDQSDDTKSYNSISSNILFFIT